MSTERRLETPPKETGKTEPGRIADADVDVPEPFQNLQAQTLASAARDAIPFCEQCATEQHAQTASQDD